MGQIVRALEQTGPQRPEERYRLVGAPYWEDGRFERALTVTLADGLITKPPDGTLAAV